MTPQDIILTFFGWCEENNVPVNRESLTTFCLEKPEAAVELYRDNVEESCLYGWGDYALTKMGNRISAITSQNRGITRRILFSALEEGLSVPQTVQRLRADWNRLLPYRAKMITRTEIMSASNYGSPGS